MFLVPESAEIIDLYKRWIPTQFDCRISVLYRRELRALLRSDDAVTLLETAITIGNFGDGAEHAYRRHVVSKLLRKKGVRLSPGKRTHPGLEKLVKDLVPLLLFFGLPLASGENSRLVRVLQVVAYELKIPGDPRDELRRRIKIERKLERDTRQMVFEAAIAGIKSDRT